MQQQFNGERERENLSTRWRVKESIRDAAIIKIKLLKTIKHQNVKSVEYSCYNPLFIIQF